MKKRAIAAIIIAAALIIGLCVLSSNPIVVRKDGIPTAFLEAIESQSSEINIQYASCSTMQEETSNFGF